MNEDIHSITASFRQTVAESIELVPEGRARYRVVTPFTYDDGDGYGVILRESDGRFFLTDEGNTFMHLSYRMDEGDWKRGTRAQIIDRVLTGLSIENKGGELVYEVGKEGFGNALFDFIQAIGKLSDLTYLSRERARSTFQEDFRLFVAGIVPKERVEYDWHHPTLDPEKYYTVDIRINHRKRPLFIYALESSGKTKDATIALQKYELWHSFEYDSVGIFERLENIPAKVTAQFVDVVGKTYSSLAANQDRIREYLERALRDTT